MIAFLCNHLRYNKIRLAFKHSTRSSNIAPNQGRFVFISKVRLAVRSVLLCLEIGSMFKKFFLLRNYTHIHVITFNQFDPCIIDCTVLVRNENGREEHQLWDVWDLKITWFQIWFKKWAMASCRNICNIKNWLIVEKSRLSIWSPLFKYGLIL